YGTLDRYAGFTDQYWSKKLAVTANSSTGERGTKRGWSSEAFQAAPNVFCFKLIAVHDPEAEARLRAWMKGELERDADPRSPIRAVGTDDVLTIRISKRHMKKLAKRGGEALRDKMTPK